MFAIFTPHNRHKVSLVIHKLIRCSFRKLSHGFFRDLNRKFYDYIHFPSRSFTACSISSTVRNNFFP